MDHFCCNTGIQTIKRKISSAPYRNLANDLVIHHLEIHGNWGQHSVPWFVLAKETGLSLSINWRFVLFCDSPLRTVPTIVIAHTFWASRDAQISNWRCLLIQGYFCAVQNYEEKAELSKCSCYPKRKLGVTTYFSEIIKLEFEKECHT